MTGNDPVRGRAAPEPARPVRDHVLVVEDDPSIRSLVAQVLRASGHDVREAADGLEALQQLTASGSPRPFVILLDLSMPRMSGWDLVARLRADATLARIPFITMTAGDGKIDGAAQALKKPFDMRELLAAVARLARAG